MGNTEDQKEKIQREVLDMRILLKEADSMYNSYKNNVGLLEKALKSYLSQECPGGVVGYDDYEECMSLLLEDRIRPLESVLDLIEERGKIDLKSFEDLPKDLD